MLLLQHGFRLGTTAQIQNVFFQNPTLKKTKSNSKFYIERLFDPDNSEIRRRR